MTEGYVFDDSIFTTVPTSAHRNGRANTSSPWISRHHQPTWLQIPAFSITRAVAFYEKALDFHFRPQTGDKDNAEGEHTVAHFSFPDGPFERILTGGIVKIPAKLQEGLKQNSPFGLSVIYFMTDDMENTLKRVEEAGGTVLKHRWQPIGLTESWCADFRDTEGNFHGLYTGKAAK